MRKIFLLVFGIVSAIQVSATPQDVFIHMQTKDYVYGRDLTDVEMALLVPQYVKMIEERAETTISPDERWSLAYIGYNLLFDTTWCENDLENCRQGDSPNEVRDSLEAGAEFMDGSDQGRADSTRAWIKDVVTNPTLHCKLGNMFDGEYPELQAEGNFVMCEANSFGYDDQFFINVDPATLLPQAILRLQYVTN